MENFDTFLFTVFLQIIPGRMGLLVTLFLSLTALLVSTITSSPEVDIFFLKHSIQTMGNNVSTGF